MAQKINPISLRLQYTNRYFDNSWYSKKYYDKLITKDILIQKYINTFLKLLKLPLGRFSIQHLPKKTRLFSFFCYPKISRNSRSRMFGVFNPSFFRKKKFYKKKKFSKFKFNEKKTKFKNNKLKFLYNKNLWFNFNWNITNKNLFWTSHLINLKKPRFNNLYIMNLYKKNLPGVNNNKIVVLKNKKKKLQVKNNFNNIFLKFYLNLLISKQFKNQKRLKHKFKSKWNLKKKITQKKPLNILKLLLATSNNPNLLLYNANNLLLFNNKSLDYLNKINLDNNKNLSQLNIRRNFRKNLFNNNKLLKESFYSQLVNFSEENLYHPKINKNNQNILISRKFKLNNIDNKAKYKNYIQQSLASIYNLDFEFIPFKVNHDWQSAGFLADEIVYFLERRVQFRRLKNKLLKFLAKNSSIRGVRITCSGRVGGKSKKAQRAKTECVKLGQTSLHVFSSQIDFAVRTAKTSFGSVGIKVWICYK